MMQLLKTGVCYLLTGRRCLIQTANDVVEQYRPGNLYISGLAFGRAHSFLDVSGAVYASALLDYKKKPLDNM